MGNPKDLAKRFNAIYQVSKTPLIIWSGINGLFLLFFSYILSQISTVKPLDMVALAFYMFFSILCLCICGRFIHSFRTIMGDKIYFSPDQNKTYTQKLTYKAIVILFITLFIFFFVSIIGIIIQGNFKELIANNNYISLLNLTLWGNWTFAYIVYYNYPKVILTKDGLYKFTELPCLIPWENVRGYKWHRRLGNYYLEISKGGRYRIIQANLKTSDKIIMDHIIKSNYGENISRH